MYNEDLTAEQQIRYELCMLVLNQRDVKEYNFDTLNTFTKFIMTGEY